MGDLADDGTRSAILAALPPSYYERGFNSVGHELRHMSGKINQDRLEEIIETRTSMLEVMTEQLSKHVMQRYDRFVDGIEAVGATDRSIKVALSAAGTARSELAAAKKDVAGAMSVIAATQHKGRCLGMLSAVRALKEAYRLPEKIRGILKRRNFAEAFWHCCHSWQSLDSMTGVDAAAHLLQIVTECYEQIAADLDGEVLALCQHFDGAQYMKVIEGHIFLETATELGGDLNSRLTSLSTGAILADVKCVLRTRQALAAKSEAASTMHDAVRLLPADLFLPCLVKVLATIFETVRRHHSIASWHDQALSKQRAALSQLQEETLSEFATAPTDIRTKEKWETLIMSVNGERKGVSNTEERMEGSDGNVTVTTISSQGIAGESTGFSKSQTDHAGHLKEEQAWGEQLEHLLGSFRAGRQFLWDELARKLGIMLVSPLALLPLHASQVLHIAQQALAFGEAFSGDDSPQLRAILASNATAAFQNLVVADLATLRDVLAHEIWKRSSLSEGGLPSLHETLTSAEASAKGTSSRTIELWLLQGNPWGSMAKAQRLRPHPSQQPSAQQSTAHVLSTNTAGTGSLPDRAPDKGVILAPQPLPASDYREAAGSGESRQGARGGNGGGALAMACGANRWLLQKMCDYCQLMRLLRPSPSLFEGICSLFDLYLLHTFVTFAEVDLAGFYSEQGTSKVQAGREKVPARLQRAISRIIRSPALASHAESYLSLASKFAPLLDAAADVLSGSMPRTATSSGRPQDTNRPSDEVGGGRSARGNEIAPSQQRPVGTLLRESMGASGGGYSGDSGPHQGVQMKSSGGSSTLTMPGFSRLKELSRNLVSSTSRSTVVANLLDASGFDMPLRTGSQTGRNAPSARMVEELRRRVVAAEALAAVVDDLRNSRSALQQVMSKQDAQSLDVYFKRTVEAADDVQDCILRAAARGALPIAELAKRIAVCDYELREPADDTAEWVGEILARAGVMAAALSTSSLSQGSILKIWTHAFAYAAEVVLAGYSGVEKGCTVAGRSTMGTDLVELSAGLRARAPTDAALKSILDAHMRLVDNFVKAFYLTSDEELLRWIELHSEYSRAEVTALVHSVASFRELRGRERAHLLSRVQEALLPGAGE